MALIMIMHSIMEVIKNTYFGNNSTLGNLALMSDVLYHEYTHGVVDHVYTTDLPYSGQTGAMNEAWADYFACTINGNPVMTEGCPAKTEDISIIP